MNDTAAASNDKSRLPSTSSACPAPRAETLTPAAAFTEISKALLAAAATKEEYNRSGGSSRLLRIAGEVAEAGTVGAWPWGSKHLALDVAELVKVSRLVPGDVCSQQRAAYIASTQPYFAFLTNSQTALDSDDIPPSAMESMPAPGIAPKEAAQAQTANAGDGLEVDAASIENPDFPLKNVLSKVRSARELIDLAVGAAEQGSHLADVLEGIQGFLLPAALSSLHSDSVSKEDVEKAYQGLFFSLSVLHTAWVVAKGTIVESALQQAFRLLNQAHTDMDEVTVAEWAIPDHHAALQAPTDALGDDLRANIEQPSGGRNGDDPRLKVALAATYEIDALLQVLRSTRHDEQNFSFAFNGVSLRLLELNSVAMSALGMDAGRSTEEMQTIVHGEGA